MAEHSWWLKEFACILETWVQSLGWEDPLEGGHGNPLQYCLESLGHSPWGCKESDMTEHTQLQVGFEMKHSEGYYRILQGLLMAASVDRR